MATLDESILPLYKSGLGCRLIAQKLNEDPTVVYKRLRRLSLVRDKTESISIGQPEFAALDFSVNGKAPSGNLSTGTAITWFMNRGYNVSIPVGMAAYDLVVETPGGMRRVQIKYTSQKNRGSNAWYCSIGHRVYAKEATLNAGGKRVAVPYTAEEIDLFFILTEDGSVFLIPVEASGGKLCICLDTKYAKYRA